ncbi:MAG TPA: hypothetical protein VFE36_04295 [Candidatus Baltobacteraceae bacterium]|jgi:hypothetical protein|nr:hypothetical protein [Candidatus Baltobacteraceae bacterium]
MGDDFGAELDAALNARLGELHSAADAARARVDRGVEAIRVVQPSPIVFSDAPRSAAVSFDLPEDEFDVPTDAEGIPLPEENV